MINVCVVDYRHEYDYFLRVDIISLNLIFWGLFVARSS
jgi:hypothetical protein